jgi:uncharacterized protein with HEPN domain
VRHPERIPSYLDRMLEAINRVEGYLNGLDHEAFLQTDVVQDAVKLNIGKIGSASRQIRDADETFETRHTDMDLAQSDLVQIADIRNYDAIDPHAVWKVATVQLPQLKQSILVLNDSPR